MERDSWNIGYRRPAANPLSGPNRCRVDPEMQQRPGRQTVGRVARVPHRRPGWPDQHAPVGGAPVTLEKFGWGMAFMTTVRFNHFFRGLSSATASFPPEARTR